MTYHPLNIFGKRVVYQVSLIEHPKNVFNMESIECYDIIQIDEMIDAITDYLEHTYNSNTKLETIILQKLQEEKQNRRYKKIRKLL